ncbi:hypothetical protein [Actinoplanes utahensis]|uniref:Uncharacterized protein n=1 Tax=Actinoplanes utahensis TaxID=1869 RepID=A0A0A6U9X1_ACTUT|nr:hypothetical protein [Actinoplanes utahensis]KHD72221.1 hypothetical protein MB27_42085 [Actinoplanes utahensis]GIF27514.1 hypothetical protein Aut01nite_05000 [Actinoplanes utahensis]
MNTPIDPFGSPDRGALHEQLTVLADEVAPADLRDRVLASSRRATVRRRSLLATSAAVAVAAVVAGVAWAGVPAAHREQVPPAATVPVPGSGAAFDDGPYVPGGTRYLSYDGRVKLAMGGAFEAVKTEFTPPGAVCGVAVSPDRARISYVTPGNGDLIVADLDGSHPRVLHTGVSCAGGDGPVWLTAPQRILVRQLAGGPRMAVDPVSGQIGETPLKDVTGYLARSPRGLHTAYRSGNEIVVLRSEGPEVVHRVTPAGVDGNGGFSVQAVTDDGRRVVIGPAGTAAEPVRTGTRLIDTATGQEVDLPAALGFPAGAEVAAIQPANRDHLLVQMVSDAGCDLYLLDAGNRVVDHRSEPAEVRAATLLPPA